MDNPHFADIAGFDWDEGNKDKNWKSHEVEYRECEEIFFNKPLLVYPNSTHSHGETRFCALGVTNAGRRIFLAFTLRNKLIRVITARNQSRKERRAYETYSS